MKVAIVGTGGIANVHAQTIKCLGHELCAVVNKNINSANDFAKKWNSKYIFSNIDDALKKDVDIVHICTPPGYHYDQIKACLMSGKHVVSEKPFCLEDSQAEELTDLAERKHLTNAVCFNNRFYEANALAKDLIAGQKVNFITASYLQSFHCLPKEYTWRFKEEPSGKMRAVTEIATHVIDLILFLTGRKIKSLSSLFIKANKHRSLKNNLMYPDSDGDICVNSEDAATINLILDNEIIANIVVSEISHGKINELKYNIDCEEKSLRWNCEEPYILNSSDLKELKSPISITPISNEFSAFDQTFVSMIGNIYSNIEDGTKPIYSSFREASYIVKTCNAIYNSANNKGVYIDL